MYVPTIDKDESLDTLAEHCIAARDIIERAGTSVMRQLIDLLLFEIGVAMAETAKLEPEPKSSD